MWLIAEVMVHLVDQLNSKSMEIVTVSSGNDFLWVFFVFWVQQGNFWLWTSVCWELTCSHKFNFCEVHYAGICLVLEDELDLNLWKIIDLVI